MTPSLARRAALFVGRRLERAFPARLESWARAMRLEIERIDGDGRALAFALGCLWAAALERLSFSAGDLDMSWKDGLREPRTIGIAAAVAATLLGLVYLAAAGAPARYMAVNLAALALGLVALRAIGEAGPSGRPWGGLVVALAGAALLATAAFGASADGASRWIRIGPLSVQVSLVLVPFMLVLFARRPDRAGAAGLALAAFALALQPDRAMAGAMALGLAALAASRRDLLSVAALLAALAAFAATLVRPDALPAVPFVDRIVYTAFTVHPLAGAAILLGLGLLVLPAVAGRWRDPAGGDPGRVFGAVWIGVIAAAALGDYPTPVVGYGGSAILGYVLSLAAFPPSLCERRPTAAGGAATEDARSEPMQRHAAIALGG